MNLILVAIFGVLSVNCAEITYSGGYKYFISHPLKKNWFQAQRYCTAHGMFLADISTPEEDQRITDLIKRPAYDNVTDKHYWLSGTDNGSEGDFYWAASGMPMLFSNWARNGPDNWKGIENCVEKTARYDLRWNDRKCEDHLYFICRGNLDLLEPLSYNCKDATHNIDVRFSDN